MGHGADSQKAVGRQPRTRRAARTSGTRVVARTCSGASGYPSCSPSSSSRSRIRPQPRARGKLRCRRSCCVRASHHPLRQAECRPRDERRDQALLGYTRTTPKPSKNYKVQETTRTSTAMPSISPGFSYTPSKNSAWWVGNMSTSSACAGSGSLLRSGMCAQVSCSSQCV